MEIGNPVTFAGCSARCSYGSPKTSQFMNSFGLELPGFSVIKLFSTADFLYVYFRSQLYQ